MHHSSPISRSWLLFTLSRRLSSTKTPIPLILPLLANLLSLPRRVQSLTTRSIVSPNLDSREVIDSTGVSFVTKSRNLTKGSCVKANTGESSRQDLYIDFTRLTISASLQIDFTTKVETEIKPSLSNLHQPSSSTQRLPYDTLIQLYHKPLKRSLTTHAFCITIRSFQFLSRFFPTFPLKSSPALFFVLPLLYLKSLQCSLCFSVFSVVLGFRFRFQFSLVFVVYVTLPGVRIVSPLSAVAILIFCSPSFVGLFEFVN